MEEEFYFTDSPNIPIDLGEKEIELSEGELTLNALAKITIIFLPRPRLQFQIDITESTAPDYFEFMGKDVVSLKIISMGVETQVFLSSTNYDFNGMEATILATSVREPVVFGSLVKKISKLNFHRDIALVQYQILSALRVHGRYPHCKSSEGIGW